MSPIVSFSETDLLRGKIVTPAWYRVRVDGVTEKLSKSGDNTVWPMEGTILYNADDGSKEFENVPTPASWNFNASPNARGFIEGYLRALGVDIEVGKRYDLAQSVGKEIDVFIDNDLYDGRTVNRINHKYRQPRSEQV